MSLNYDWQIAAATCDSRLGAGAARGFADNKYGSLECPLIMIGKKRRQRAIPALGRVQGGVSPIINTVHWNVP